MFDWREAGDDTETDARRGQLEKKVSELLKRGNPEMDALQISGMVEGMSTTALTTTLSMSKSTEWESSDASIPAMADVEDEYGDYVDEDGDVDTRGWIRSDDGESWHRVGPPTARYHLSMLFQGREFPLPDTSGGKFIGVLLASPSREFDSLELDRFAGGEITENQGDWESRGCIDIPIGEDVELDSRGDIGISVGRLPDDLPMIEADAISETRAQLRSLRADVAQAKLRRDEKAATRLQEDIASIEQWLRQGTNVHGEPRTTGPHERSRVNIHNAVRRTIDIIARTEPELAAHLWQHIKPDGGLWAYRGALVRVRWTRVTHT